MRKLYIIQLLVLLVCIGCEWRWASTEDGAADGSSVQVERYDRVETMYLMTGDFSALQQMNTGYPQQTRTLIEDVLRLGRVNDPEINQKFLAYFQDSTLQCLLADVNEEFLQMDDINEDLSEAFMRLKRVIPGIELPTVYAQVGSLDQSIVVAGKLLGISLDKYLGADYPLYLRPNYGYTEKQRSVMTREFIVPDCMSFYLLSLYPMPANAELSQLERDMHMGKIQWVVNSTLKKDLFQNLYVRMVARYMSSHPQMTVDQMLRNTDSRSLR